MFANSLFRFIAMILFIIMFLGCGKATITCSTIKTKNEAIETVDRIVNAAFVDMGHGGGDISLRESRPYLLYFPNKYGKMEMYIYYVSLFESRNRVVVEIKNVIAGSDPDRLEKINEYLLRITSKIEKMLREAHIEATIETKKRSEFIKACI